MNYYNDFDKASVAWLKQLVKRGIIPQGDVDDRPIQEVQAHELSGYTQCHFFAGVGGWPIALSIAGWGTDRPVWTGSCPCQPFSVAGDGKGSEDERHLWPDFARLIFESEPSTVFGEQVASKLGREWLAGVRLDLAAMGYAVGAADLCAAGVGAPHIRQRLFWVANAESNGCKREQAPRKWRTGVTHGGRLANPNGNRRNERRPEREGFERGDALVGSGTGCRLGNTDSERLEKQRGTEPVQAKQPGAERAGFWYDSTPIPCADGKARRVGTRSPEMVDGVSGGASCCGNECDCETIEILCESFPGRSSLLRGYGNAICVQVAEVFIRSFMELMEDRCEIAKNQAQGI